MENLDIFILTTIVSALYLGYAFIVLGASKRK
jgi:hypothetical protein